MVRGGRRSSFRSRAASAVVGALVVLAAVGIVLLARGRDRVSSGGKPVDLTGTWNVIGINRGSEHLAVPSYVSAMFNFDVAGQYVDAYDGVSAYGCSYSRSGNALTLSDCAVTADAGSTSDQIRTAIADVYKHAMGNSSMSISTSRHGQISVRLGDTTFTATRSN
jgi:hypothetical protein